MSDAERTQREVFRVSPEEKAAIKALAKVHGLPPGTYARQAALGQLGSRPSPPRSHEPEPERLSTVNVAVTPEGSVAIAPRVEAEVAEAKLEDDPAREAFLERRTRELYGQGKTTILARAEAEAEWRNR